MCLHLARRRSLTVGGSLGTCQGEETFTARSIPFPGSPRSLQHLCSTDVVSKSRRFSACDDLSPQHDLSLMADGNEHLTQGLRKRRCLHSHREESLGFTYASSRACFRSRRLCVMHPVRYRIGRCREFRVSVVVVWCRLVVWRFGVECDSVCLTQVSPWTCWGPSTGGQ